MKSKGLFLWLLRSIVCLCAWREFLILSSRVTCVHGYRPHHQQQHVSTLSEADRRAFLRYCQTTLVGLGTVTWGPPDPVIANDDTPLMDRYPYTWLPWRRSMGDYNDDEEYQQRSIGLLGSSSSSSSSSSSDDESTDKKDEGKKKPNALKVEPSI
jgi:hypothetical protein